MIWRWLAPRFDAALILFSGMASTAAMVLTVTMNTEV